MSHNQSRSERSSESALYRQAGRPSSSNLQRSFSASSGRGGGTAPPSSSSSLSSNRSYKKLNNAQGGQTRESGLSVISESNNTASAVRTSQNGAHIQPPPLQGVPDAPITNTSGKPTDVSTKKTTRAVPKAPSAATTVSSDASASSTPAKGDASGSFSLQFGSISPSFMKPMQIPARTSSAPPNLDEQKRDKARHDSSRTAPAVPTLPIPRQLPRKEVGAVDRSSSGEAHPTSKAKKDIQGSTGPPSIHAHKPIHTMPVNSMPLQFHQPHVQYTGPNPQIQSQGMTATSLQMQIAMQLPVASAAQMAPQVFVSPLQPHHLPSQGLIPQGPSLSFTSQIGHQLSPQLNNMGINSLQFSQQQAAKFATTRKAVKITHPETHEELSFDKRSDTHMDSGSSGPRTHPSVPPQSQPIPSFSPGHNFISIPYGGTSMFYNPQSSLSPSNSPSIPTSQAPRFYNQVTVKPSSASNGEKVDSSLSVTSPAVEKSDSPILLRQLGEASSTYPQKDSENGMFSQPSKSDRQPTSSSMLTSKLLAAVSGDGSVVRSPSFSLPVPFKDPSLVPTTSAEGTKGETINRSDSIKDDQTKSGKKGHSLPSNSVSVQTTSIGSSPPLSLEPSNFQNVQSLETLGTIEDKMTFASSMITGATSEAKELSPVDAVVPPEPSDTKSDSAVQATTCELLKASNDGITSDQSVSENVAECKGKILLPKELKKIESRLKTSDEVGKTEESLIQVQGMVDEHAGSIIEDNRVTHTSELSTSRLLDTRKVETIPLSPHLSTIPSGKGASNFDASTSHDDLSGKEVDGNKLGMLNHESLHVSDPSVTETTLKCEGENADARSTGLVFPLVSSSKDKPLPDPNKGKNNIAQKIKKKEMLKKADAAGTTSDLYMAYKGPEDKKEAVTSPESAEITPSISLKKVHTDDSQEALLQGEKDGQIKAEPDDWEDAAEITTPELETSDNGKQIHRGLKYCNEDSNVLIAKKYSRDFLLKFADQCIDLPEDFETTSDIAEVLTVSNVNSSWEGYTSSGRVTDRQAGLSRGDRRDNGMGDHDRWSRQPGPRASGRGNRSDIGYGPNAVGIRPGHGGNSGVLRNPRAQTPVHYAGGILSGPMQSVSHQGAQRISPDSDRWPRATAFQKGLIPYPSPPQTPSQLMHKAEKKYEIGKISDEEDSKQRQLKAILNKLTPQNFEKLFEQVKQVNIDNGATLANVIAQIFDKALMEPTFCEMYANFCSHLAAALPDLSVDTEKITFKRLLLNKCQEEFERGEREQEEANKADEGEAKLSEEEREEKRIRARRRMLGNIRLIGELYKKRMLTERIMHECILKLLGQPQNPDEEDVEALCKLMSTIGEMIDHSKAKEHMDAYFVEMMSLSNNMKLSSRVRFMLKDAIDLRKNKWQQRRKVEGPKKIEEVHRDAAQERQAQVSRMGRAPGISSSVRRGQPLEYASRGSNILSPSSAHIGSSRGLSPHLRGFGAQDVWMEDRHSFENRALSVPLTSQRPIGDDSITLGPHGGLAKGMSFRGHSNTAALGADIPSPVDTRRVTPELNGYSSVVRTAHGSREDTLQRYNSERFMGPTYDAQERNMNYGNRDTRNADQSLDRSLPTSLPTRLQGSNFVQTVSSEQALSEERLKDMSLAAIKEFYCAKDEKEVALCVKDLKSPSFYPSMISIWVTDSFERKDMERDLLAKLLINLAKSRDMILSQDQLIKGFESVLISLEDAVNDAPRAAEFLGRIFGKVISENVIPLTVIGQMISEGGEEGHLVEIGLAAEVLGSAMEMIKIEKGDTVLSEIRSMSNLRLEDFRAPGSNKSSRLDKFI